MAALLPDGQAYADPTFDEVARREAAALRVAERLAVKACRKAAALLERRASPEYRAQRRRHIQRVMMQVRRERGG